MERIISPEERMKRAEEIYYRRKAQGVRVSTATVNVGKQNKVSLGHKMIIQIIICIVIYTAFQLLKGYNNIFSENVVNHTKSILSYDMNFQELYYSGVEYFSNNFNSIIKVDGNVENEGDINKDQEVSESNETDKMQEDKIGENTESSAGKSTIVEDSQDYNANGENNALQENNLNGENISQGEELNSNTESNATNISTTETEITPNTTNDGTQKAKLDAENKTQMEEDAEFIKQNYNLIHPIEGVITSEFGAREETEIISAFHQGIDISATSGTPIHAAMEGEVVASSYAGDYGNHIKIQNGEVLTVYAHCSELEVNVGDHISQGQEIAKVGATGKVTRSTSTF